jgi:hypothetical protein
MNRSALLLDATMRRPPCIIAFEIEIELELQHGGAESTTVLARYD